MGKDLSEEQIDPMREAFSLFDTDRITAAKLGTVMQSLGENPTQTELKEIIKREEISGTIDFPHFLVVMKRNLKGGSFHVQLRDAFKALDKEGTGKISVGELASVDAWCIDNLPNGVF